MKNTLHIRRYESWITCFALRFTFFTLLLPLLSSHLIAQSDGYSLTNNGTDPTEVRTRIDIYFAQVKSLAGRDLFGSQISGDYQFAQRFSLGLDLPYIHSELSGGRVGAGIGDIALRGKFMAYQQKKVQLLKAISLDLGVIMDTGDADQGTGTGQYALVPSVSASLTLADEFIIVPTIEQYGSFSDEGEKINDIRFKILNIVQFSGDIWVSIRPELIIDLTGEYQSSYPIRTVFGIMLDENFGLSAQYTHFLAGDQRVSAFANVDLRYLF